MLCSVRNAWALLQWAKWETFPAKALLSLCRQLGRLTLSIGTSCISTVLGPLISSIGTSCIFAAFGQAKVVQVQV